MRHVVPSNFYYFTLHLVVTGVVLVVLVVVVGVVGRVEDAFRREQVRGRVRESCSPE